MMTVKPNDVMLQKVINDFLTAKGLEKKNNLDIKNDLKGLPEWLLKQDEINKIFVDTLFYIDVLNANYDTVIEIGKMGADTLAHKLNRCFVATDIITPYPTTFEIIDNNLNCMFGGLTEDGKILANGHELLPSELVNKKVLFHNISFTNGSEVSYMGLVNLIKQGVTVIIGSSSIAGEYNQYRVNEQLRKKLYEDTGEYIGYHSTIIDNADIDIITYKPKVLEYRKIRNR